MATVIAGLIVAVVLVGYVSNSAEGEPFIPVVALLAAGVIWVVGWTFRILLRDR
jgi:hypothetical protein